MPLDLDGCSIHRARSHQKGEFFFLQMKHEFENLEERKEIIDHLPLPLPDIYKASSKTSPPPSTRNRTRSKSRVESQPDRTIGVVETPERGCPLAGQRRGSAWPGCGLGWGGVGWVRRALSCRWVRPAHGIRVSWSTTVPSRLYLPWIFRTIDFIASKYHYFWKIPPKERGYIKYR